MRVDSVEDLQGLLAEYKGDQNELRQHIASLLWHMRGGLSREEAWSLSPEERKDMIKFIESRVKIVEKTGLALM